MNTTEINSSAWPLKYYFITAFPLAVLTVAVPLYFIKVIAFLARTMNKRNKLALCLAHFLFGVSFVVSIISDILAYIGKGGSLFICPVILYFLMLMLVVAEILGEISWYRRKRPNIATIRGRLWKQRSLAIRILLIISIYISFYFQAFVEIPFYVLYYINMFCGWIKRKRAAKTI